MRIGLTALRSVSLTRDLRQKQKRRKSASLEDRPDGLEERSARAELEGKDGEIDTGVVPVIYCDLRLSTRSRA